MLVVLLKKIGSRYKVPYTGTFSFGFVALKKFLPVFLSLFPECLSVGKACSAGSMAVLVLLAFLLLLAELYNPAVVGGLPGGGTSLLISSEAPVAILPKFTALANSTSFTIEVWYNAFLNGDSGTAVAMVTADETELVRISIYEGYVL